jgi:hypothetical protein
MAIVDDINRFPEERKDNNVLIKQLNFGPRDLKLPDSIILNLSLSHGRFTAGDHVTFEALVRNVGMATTGDVVGVAFLVDGQQITFGIAPAMGPGETRSIRAISTWQATPWPHGPSRSDKTPPPLPRWPAPDGWPDTAASAGRNRYEGRVA